MHKTKRTSVQQLHFLVNSTVDCIHKDVHSVKQVWLHFLPLFEPLLINYRCSMLHELNNVH